MDQFFTRVAAATPKIKVGDPLGNAELVALQMQEAVRAGARVLVFPELVLTGYTCGDLFHQQILLDGAKQALDYLMEVSRELPVLTFVGLPYRDSGKLYNAAAAIYRGRLLALIPKKNLPNYGEFYELRWFSPADEEVRQVMYPGYGKEPAYAVPFGTRVLLHCDDVPGLVVGAELCEDVWVPCPPSTGHALAGATLMVNCSASDETAGKDVYRRELIRATSARLICGYVYANAGEGESTQDLVFGGQNLICENGTLLAESRRFACGIVYGDIDLERLQADRMRQNTFPSGAASEGDYVRVHYSYGNVAESYVIQTVGEAETVPGDSAVENRESSGKDTLEAGLERPYLYRHIDPHPFVPSDAAERNSRCEEILMIQTMGLKKRLEHTGTRSAVLGISGGLDSTLALLVTVRAFDLLGLPRTCITCVTMPCFGTTDRTYQNALTLTRQLGVSLREINIRAAVLQHFADLGHDPADHSVTYENAQARERTQILMDVANQTNGMVVGTGDMSELALGWATYNGDHMSMYGVNAGVPKTLVRYLVQFEADVSSDADLAACLYDILDTPVSPELLPPEESGDIAQKTEDLVGPYELHDFYLYQILRYGYHPKRVFEMALYAFGGETARYDRETILKWLKVFYRRFFSQQFKRSCLPDGPKVGSAALSPRGDLRMPSDAVAALWLKELEELG